MLGPTFVATFVCLGELDVDTTVSTSQAMVVAEKLKATLSEPYQLQVTQSDHRTIEYHCTASIGVVIFSGNEASQTDILKWADSAMYQAKDAGRNSIRFWERS